MHKIMGFNFIALFVYSNLSAEEARTQIICPIFMAELLTLVICNFEE